MKLFLSKILFIAGIVVKYTCIPEEKNPFNFEFRPVSTDLPEEKGNLYGTPTIADFDNDGDIDFTLSVTRKKVYWFEMLQDKTLVKHKAGEISTGQLGGWHLMWKEMVGRILW